VSRESGPPFLLEEELKELVLRGRWRSAGARSAWTTVTTHPAEAAHAAKEFHGLGFLRGIKDLVNSIHFASVLEHLRCLQLLHLRDRCLYFGFVESVAGNQGLELLVKTLHLRMGGLHLRVLAAADLLDLRYLRVRKIKRCCHKIHSVIALRRLLRDGAADHGCNQECRDSDCEL